MEEDIVYKPVDNSNWTDLVKLFEGRGGPHNCWCMVWRNMEARDADNGKAGKKSALKQYVESGKPIGLLGYSNADPVAWCSIAPRTSYRDLKGDASISEVWSLVCFFIKRAYRKKGLTVQLIKAAEAYAKNNGARYVEAYPVDFDSPSYRFMGFKPIFEKLDFEFKHKTGKRRYVMVKEVCERTAL